MSLKKVLHFLKIQIIVIMFQWQDTEHYYYCFFIVSFYPCLGFLCLWISSVRPTRKGWLPLTCTGLNSHLSNVLDNQVIAPPTYSFGSKTLSFDGTKASHLESHSLWYNNFEAKYNKRDYGRSFYKRSRYRKSAGTLGLQWLFNTLYWFYQFFIHFPAKMAYSKI